jgi:hypothetical protein
VQPLPGWGFGKFFRYRAKPNSGVIGAPAEPRNHGLNGDLRRWVGLLALADLIGGRRMPYAPCPGVIRVEPDGLVVVLDGAVRLAFVIVGDTPVVEGFGKISRRKALVDGEVRSWGPCDAADRAMPRRATDPCRLSCAWSSWHRCYGATSAFVIVTQAAHSRTRDRRPGIARERVKEKPGTRTYLTDLSIW